MSRLSTPSFPTRPSLRNTARRSSRLFGRAPIWWVAAVAVITLIITAGVSISAASYFNVSTSNECVVTGKDRTTNSEGQSQARIYTDNCGTFQVGDDLFRGKFTSADTYGSIQEGNTYDFQTTGFRIGFLSMFPNIIEVTAR